MDQIYKWKFPGYVGYVLESTCRLPARKVSGSQGVFYVDLSEEERELLQRKGF
jgi:hypothetical protein